MRRWRAGRERRPPYWPPGCRCGLTPALEQSSLRRLRKLDCGGAPGGAGPGGGPRNPSAAGSRASGVGLATPHPKNGRTRKRAICPRRVAGVRQSPAKGGLASPLAPPGAPSLLRGSGKKGPAWPAPSNNRAGEALAQAGPLAAEVPLRRAWPRLNTSRCRPSSSRRTPSAPAASASPPRRPCRASCASRPFRPTRR